MVWYSENEPFVSAKKRGCPIARFRRSPPAAIHAQKAAARNDAAGPPSAPRSFARMEDATAEAGNKPDGEPEFEARTDESRDLAASPLRLNDARLPGIAENPILPANAA